MTWNDDGWKDGYDAWKLASPDEYDDGLREDDCDHEDYDSDLAGFAMCHRCGHRWMQTSEEMQRDAEHHAAYARMEARWNRSQWWHDLWASIRAILPRRKQIVLNDDDIPF